MKSIVVLGLLLLLNLAWAKQAKTEHTYGLADGAPRPSATIEQVAWLAGSWQGEAFGQQFEEVWNPPSAGTMVGMFKLFDSERGVNFYEIMLITPQENSLSLLVKHFSAEFVSWEDPADHVNFKLVAIEDHAIHFSGLSFYRINDHEMHAYLAMRQKDGHVKEEKLTFKRR